MQTNVGEIGKLHTILEAPEPFPSALRDHLSSRAVRSILFAPPYVTEADVVPATVMAVTDEGWLVASANDEGGVNVDQSTFSDTLLLELTSILLWGQLKIDFGATGTASFATTRFNTAQEKYYREAIDLVLDGIDPAGMSSGGTDDESVAAIEEWPLKFRNQVRQYLPAGQRLIGGTHWPAIEAGFGRELVPAAALLVTKRELVLIAEEKTPDWFRGKGGKYGGIITYFPLVRLADFHTSREERFSVLAFEVNAAHGKEKFEILFPSDHEQTVTKTIEQARAAGAERTRSGTSRSK